MLLDTAAGEPTEEAPAYRRIPEDCVNACALRVSSNVICAMNLIAHALWRECDSNQESRRAHTSSHHSKYIVDVLS